MDPSLYIPFPLNEIDRTSSQVLSETLPIKNTLRAVQYIDTIDLFKGKVIYSMGSVEEQITIHNLNC